MLSVCLLHLLFELLSWLVLVTTKLLFHCLFRFSNSFLVANLTAISMHNVPNVIGVYCVCALSDKLVKEHQCQML